MRKECEMPSGLGDFSESVLKPANPFRSRSEMKMKNLTSTTIFKSYENISTDTLYRIQNFKCKTSIKLTPKVQLYHLANIRNEQFTKIPSDRRGNSQMGNLNEIDQTLTQGIVTWIVRSHLDSRFRWK
ncbi:hypothetical protein NPIL_150841 [Nephila pilipes]|uniref:Uncharacterized protein n=1 Tax=Nephila pilipes TaxID=299642 RepID=A0A8X6QQ34_NEPPI|nr:hypothetical protein NPIL_150841 [Nephila pilipes]